MGVYEFVRPNGLLVAWSSCPRCEDQVYQMQREQQDEFGVFRPGESTGEPCIRCETRCEWCGAVTPVDDTAMMWGKLGCLGCQEQAIKDGRE